MAEYVSIGFASASSHVIRWPRCTLSVLRFFVHFLFLSLFLSKIANRFNDLQNNWRKSRIECCDFTFFCSFFKKTNKKIQKTFYGNHNCFLWHAIVRGSVFKMVFRVLFREFESIETYPGFALLLGENWN